MTTETLEKFYMRKLPELRRKRDVTRKEVAQGVGVTLGKYDKWEERKICLLAIITALPVARRILLA